MITRDAPRHFIIKDGKLTPKTQPQQDIENYRVITYNHTVRVLNQDYATATIKQLKAQIQQWKKDYGLLQKAYWHFLGAKTDDSPSQTKSFKKQDYLQETALSISQFSTISEDSIHRFSEDMINQIQETKQSLNNMSYSSITCLSDKNNFSNILSNQINEKSIEQQEKLDEEFQEKLVQAFDEIQRLKQQLQQNQNVYQQLKEVNKKNDELELTVKKLQEILEREKKNSRMLNQMIGRMRKDINNKDNIIKDISGLRKYDKTSIECLLRKHGISKLT